MQVTERRIRSKQEFEKEQQQEQETSVLIEEDETTWHRDPGGIPRQETSQTWNNLSSTSHKHKNNFPPYSFPQGHPVRPHRIHRVDWTKEVTTWRLFPRGDTAEKDISLCQISTQHSLVQQLWKELVCKRSVISVLLQKLKL